MDIRPWIYQAEIRGEQIYLYLAAGSVQNLKPDLVMGAEARIGNAESSWILSDGSGRICIS